MLKTSGSTFGFHLPPLIWDGGRDVWSCLWSQLLESERKVHAKSGGRFTVLGSISSIFSSAQRINSYQAALALSAVREEVQIFFQYLGGIRQSHVGGKGASKPWFDEWDLPDGRRFEQMFRYPRLWIEEPDSWGLPGVLEGGQDLWQARGVSRARRGRESGRVCESSTMITQGGWRFDNTLLALY